MVNEHDTVFRAKHYGFRDCHQGRTAEKRVRHRLHFIDQEQGQRDRTTALMLLAINIVKTNNTL